MSAPRSSTNSYKVLLLNFYKKSLYHFESFFFFPNIAIQIHGSSSLLIKCNNFKHILMKILKTSAIAALLSISFLSSSAQQKSVPLNEPNYNKPKLFTDLPDKLTVRLTDMEGLLNLSIGEKVNTTVANGFQLVGTVVSKSNPTNTSAKTIVIKSLTRQGATLTFSRITKEDGTYSYIGRMMSKGAGDALEIARDGAGYVLRKKDMYDLMNE